MTRAKLATKTQKRVVQMLVDAGQLPYMPSPWSDVTYRDAAELIQSAVDSEDAPSARVVDGRN